MRILISLFFIALSIPSFSQTAVGNSDGSQTFIDLKDNFATYIGLQPKSEGVIGSPFLFEDLKKAKVTMITGKTHDNVLANILPSQSELYVQIKPNNIVVPEASYIESILFIEDSILFKPIRLNDRLMYAQSVFETNDKQFFALVEKKFVKANVGGAYNSGPKFDEYKEVISYYLLENSEITEIKKNNSGIKFLAGEKWKEAREFVNKQNIDFNIVSDMQKVFVFIEKL